MELWIWVTIGLAVATAITGGLVKKLSTALRETGDLLTTLGVAMEDNKITKAEAADILKEWVEAKSAWLSLMRR